jgi:hypothetical protein
MGNKKVMWVVGLLCMIGLLVVSCKGPLQPTYDEGNPDPNPTGGQAAAITSVNPTEGYLREDVTIQGSGFNPSPEFNFVAFGTKTGTVVTASATQLVVTTPAIAGQTVKVKVAIKGSEFWSNQVDFTFKEAVNWVADDINWPMGVEADDAGNVYVGSAGDEVIYKIAPDGTQSEFAAVAPSGAMGWGPDGYLYVAQSWEGKIVRISPDGSTIEDYVESGAAVDFDWASSGNMYILRNWGEGIDMYDGTTVTHVMDYDGENKSCRIFDDYFYMCVIWNGTIVRFPITSDGLGDEEVVYEGDSPVGLEFDAEGTMYFTEAWETTLYTIKADGTEEALFVDELLTPMRYLTFHNKILYIVYPGWGDVGEVVSAYIGVDQAPNWGLQ